MSTTPLRFASLVRPRPRPTSMSMSVSSPRFRSIEHVIPNTPVNQAQANTRLIHSSYPKMFPTSHSPNPTSLSHTAHPTPPHQQPHVTSHPTSGTHGHAHGPGHQHAPPRSGSGKKKSPHLVWYREIVPAMIPIFLISTTLFLSLSLIRTHLSHSKSLSESTSKIEELEAQLAQLRLEQRRSRVREKRERERILPLVVERVLQRVGVVGGEEDEGDGDEEEEEQREMVRLL
ncbi:hypothetical protein I317_06774 [Kwoniella heveanensis CBS 569]|nr:hypothetical protein I317_06774 [Kwoniella heveanensis CBS 569]